MENMTSTEISIVIIAILAGISFIALLYTMGSISETISKINHPEQKKSDEDKDWDRV